MARSNLIERSERLVDEILGEINKTRTTINDIFKEARRKKLPEETVMGAFNQVVQSRLKSRSQDKNRATNKDDLLSVVGAMGIDTSEIDPLVSAMIDYELENRKFGKRKLNRQDLQSAAQKFGLGTHEIPRGISVTRTISNTSKILFSGNQRIKPKGDKIGSLVFGRSISGRNLRNE